MPEAYKDENRPVTIVLISGSLRARSVNGAVVETAAKLLPAGARAVVYRRLADLTHFNPDEDRDPLPEPVAEMRELIRAADAVLFSTPEYAGSLPGSFKNLLDWTVGGSCIYCLPVSWINPSAHGGSQDTYTALRIVLEPPYPASRSGRMFKSLNVRQTTLYWTLFGLLLAALVGAGLSLRMQNEAQRWVEQGGGYAALLLAGLLGWANIRDGQRQVTDLRRANVALEEALAKARAESERGRLEGMGGVDPGEPGGRRG